MAPPRIEVRPAVLRWARESAGLAPEDAAAKIGVAPARLEDAERGGSPLTLAQVRKAALAYERPLAALFLPAPLDEESNEVQFRRLRDAPQLPWPPEMRALARRLPALQDEAAELYESLDEQPQINDAAPPAR